MAAQTAKFKVFTGTQFLPIERLTYEASYPLVYDIPLAFDKPRLTNFSATTHCEVDENSVQCIIEKNLHLIQQKVENQIAIQLSHFPDGKINITRQARSILFLGEAMTWCCGLINSKQFSKTTFNQKAINTNLNTLLDYTRQEHNNTNLLKSHFQEFAQDTKNLTDQIQHNLLILQEEFFKIKDTDLSKNILFSIQNLWQAIFQNFKFDNLRHLQAQCNGNYLSRALIPKELLKTDLQTLQNILHLSNYTLAIDIHKEVNSYYELPLASCTWSREKLTYKLQVPIIKTNTSYKVYKNIQVPLLWDDKLCYLTQNEFLVIHSKNDIRIIPQDSENCNAHTYPLCLVPRITQWHDTQYHCIKSLFQNLNLSNVKAACHMHCQNATQFPKIIAVSPSTYLIANIRTTLYIVCHNSTLNQKLMPNIYGVTQLTLKCQCAVETASKETLIHAEFPCDYDKNYEITPTHLIPQIWTTLDNLIPTPLSSELNHEIDNVTSILDEQWALKIPTFHLKDTLKIDKNHFELPNQESEIFSSDNLYLIILAAWTAILSFIIMILGAVIYMIHIKTQLIISSLPPRIPPRQ